MVYKVFSYYENESIAREMFDNIEWAAGDILDYPSLLGALEGTRQVYHAAAFVSFNPADKHRLMENNVKGTRHIVNACLEQKVEKLGMVSSVAALGDPVDSQSVDEQDIWKPSGNKNGYAASKYYSEMEVWRGIAEGLNAVIVNPSIILGPGNWQQGSASIIYNIYKGLPFYTKGITGFVDVRDVAKAAILLMEKNISAERFILNAENLSYQEVFTEIAKSLSVKPPGWYASPFLSETAWRAMRVLHFFRQSAPAITRETARAAHHVTRFNNQKIKEALDFNFLPVKESIRQNCRLFLNDLSTIQKKQ